MHSSGDIINNDHTIELIKITILEGKQTQILESKKYLDSI